MSKASIIETELKAIWDARGNLTAATVVEVATDEAHPLHGFFEWDDSAAAHRFRIGQAGALIRSVKVHFTREHNGEIEDISIRGWMPARAAGTLDPAPAGYLPESEVRMNPEHRTALLRQMQRDLQNYRRRYQHLAEFWATVVEIAEEAPEQQAS